jgi:hypothetical protein
MDSIQSIGIIVVLAISGLSLLGMFLFGIRSFIFGKVSKLTTGAVLLPVVLLAILGFVLGDWPTAAIYTLVIMLVIAVIAVVLSSAKGLVRLG